MLSRVGGELTWPEVIVLDSIPESPWCNSLTVVHIA